MFVSINYRLGVFGNLAGTVLSDAGVTNMGFRDQRQALFWVQENIGAFGGDRRRVAIMGESAGTDSVGLHMLARGGTDEGLFQRGIAQSGGPLSSGAFSTVARLDADFAKVLAATNCTGTPNPLLCLRSAPAVTLNSVSHSVAAINAVDSDLVRAPTSEMLGSDSFIKVPLLIGSNRNEGSVFMSGAVNNESDLSQLITSRASPYPIPAANLSFFLQTYQDPAVLSSPDAGLGTVLASPSGTACGASWGAATLWATDYIVAAGRRLAAKAWARNDVACYSYLFDAPTANVDRETQGATHAMELPFTFGDQNGVGWEQDPFPVAKVDRTKYRALSQRMARRWIGFIVNGDPNLLSKCSSLMLI